MSDDTHDDDALLDGVEKGKLVRPHGSPGFIERLEDPLYADLSLLLLRVITASLVVHHGLDKLEHVDGFSNNVIAVYFPLLPGPPVFWTYLSAAFELVGSFCVTVGLFTRLASALLAGTMVNAIAFHPMKFGLQRFPLNPPAGAAYTFEPSLSFLGVTVYLLFRGPGRFALRPSGY